MFSPDSEDRKTTRPQLRSHHARQIGPRQAHAGHDVDLEEPRPFAVRDLEEVLRAEDADIVHENVGGRLGLHQRRAPLGGAEIGRHAADRGAGTACSQRGERGIDGGLLAAVDHDLAPAAAEALGDGEADAGGRAGDDGGLAR